MTGDPERLLREILERESGFLPQDLEETLRAIADDAEMNRRMAREWRARPRRTQKDVSEYYASSKTWLMQTYGQGHGALADLARRKVPENRPPWTVPFMKILLRGATVLDYGGGFLKDSWFLPLLGIKVVLVEIDGPVTRVVRSFLKAIGEDRVEVLPASENVPALGEHGGAICFEVLEHMADPVGSARQIVSSVAPGGPVALSATFGAPEHAPYHIAGNAKFGDPGVWSTELVRMGLEPVWTEEGSNIGVWRRR